MLVFMSVSRVIASAAAVLVTVAACSPIEKVVEPISARDLATAVSERLEDELNAPFAINCPDPLPAEVGATAECEITSLTASVGDVVVTATVTDVDTETGHVSFSIDAASATAPADEIDLTIDEDATEESEDADEASQDEDSSDS